MTDFEKLGFKKHEPLIEPGEGREAYEAAIGPVTYREPEQMEARWYQEDANKELIKCLQEDDKCHPIVVAPTGSGKSFMICDFIDKYLSLNPTAHILVLSHIKEILQQDLNAIQQHFDGFEVGLYSTGMESKTIKKITIAGIQSAYRHPDKFKHFNIVIIDECHRITINQTGMYRTLLKELKANYVGFTATHFRLGHGYIHKGEGALFNKIAYDMSSVEIFNRLVEEGFLTKLITKGTIMRMSTNGLRIVAGDYVSKDLSKRFDREAITEEAVKEIIEFGHNYKRWLIFAIDIDHAENVCAMLNKLNVKAAVVHSKMIEDRDDVVADFRKGLYRAMVNVDILTTGFDVPEIDLIAMLRPTQSPVVHVQTIGRGLRVAEGKDHCLVLDFAGNTMRLGPINDVSIKTREHGISDVGAGGALKECKECKTLVPIATKFCPVCGFEFKFLTNLRERAGTEEVVRTTPKKKPPEWYDVDDVIYTVSHGKKDKPDTLKVTYRIGPNAFSEWICYDHTGYAKNKANNWVRFRAPIHDDKKMPMPKDVKELWEWSNWLKKPTKVFVSLDDKFPQIKRSEFKTVVQAVETQVSYETSNANEDGTDDRFTLRY